MKKRLFDISFYILAALIVLVISRKPIYNWDMIPYMGVAVEYEIHDMKKVHDIVYADLKQEVAPQVYHDLTYDIEDRHQCLTDVNVFKNEMSFFRTKPLYTFMVFVLYHAGFSLVHATLIPSIIAGYLLLILVYTWLSEYLKKPLAFAMSLIVALFPMLAELERFSTPDAISNLFVLSSLYILATDKSRKWLWLYLFLAVFTRVDNFIFVAVIAFFTYLRDKKNMLITVAAIGIFSAACLFLIPYLLGDSFDWFTKFAFLFSYKNYINHWKDVLYTFRDAHYLLLLMVSVFLFLSKEVKTQFMIRIIGITILLHLMLFPSLQERFYVAYEIAIICLLIRYMALTAKERRYFKVM